MLTKGKAKKLTVFVTESDTRHGRPVFQILVEMAHKHGLAGATVTRGLMGYGAGGTVHTAHPDLASKLPVRVEIVDSAEAIDRILPDVYDLVDEGLVELSDVEVVKYKPRQPQPGTAEGHVKLEGKAKMMRVHVGANDQWEGEPLYEALIKRFHLLDLAGATVYRGVAGYGASGRVHRHTLLHHGDDPITVVVVDTVEKLQAAMPAIDEMVGSGMVVLSDVDVVFYRHERPNKG
jgi:PII-like signaling protein